MLQALDAGTASVLPEGLRAELEQLEDSGGVRHLNDLKEQIQARRRRAAPARPCRNISAALLRFTVYLLFRLDYCTLIAGCAQLEAERCMKRSAQRSCMGLGPGRSVASVVHRLQGLRKVAIDELGNVERDLQREASEDAELRERHRAAWRRPASAALNAKFLEKVAGERCLLHCMCTALRVKFLLEKVAGQN